jgi:pSer/pThr/pTyr-binding forkhead associated (FHA) protein
MGGVTGRVILFTLAGFAAGLLTWFISDVSGIVHISDQVGKLSPEEARGYWIVFTAWGGFISVLLGVAETLQSGATASWGKVIGLGLLVGIVSGVVGGALGMILFQPLYVYPAVTPFDFVRNVVARAIGWALIGALAGTAAGWRKMSFRIGRNGFLGGLIGGLVGGCAFEIVPYLLVGMRHPGVVARLFGFVITGAMIGLFVALVQEWLKEAWVRIVAGRNEGKEVLIDKEMTRIGRSELSDIALFGDPSVARTHAVLVAQPGGRFLIEDTGESPLGVVVNGQRIAGEKPLFNGDQIQLGGKMLIFYERLTKTPTVPVERDVAPPRMAASPGLPSLADLPAAAALPAPAASPMSQPASIVAPPLPHSVVTLVATNGPHAGARFSVTPGAVIGRDPAAEISLSSDSKASRTHARLVADGAGYAIEDAGSTNGTFVNGQRVTRQILAVGDTIIIGTTALRFE